VLNDVACMIECARPQRGAAALEVSDQQVDPPQRVLQHRPHPGPHTACRSTLNVSVFEVFSWAH